MKNDNADNSLQLGNYKSNADLISRFTYNVDAVGNRTQMVITEPAKTDTIDYSYDNAYRLTREARVSTNPAMAYTEEFNYDAMGNRTERRKSVQGGAFATTDYAYNAANQLTSEFASGTQTDYSYDGNGNMIQKQAGADVTSYEFDSLDRMTSATANGVTSSYSYDVSGKRIRKNLIQSGQGVTEYWHQGDNVLAEINPMTSEITAAYNTPFLDENISINKNGQTYYYMQDGLGSVRNILDAAQDVSNRYDYNAWGESVSEQELVSNPFKYTGREWDNETSQYNYRSRYYNPVIGRFNQKDKIGFNGGYNLYAYVTNSPINDIDSFGYDGDGASDSVTKDLYKWLQLGPAPIKMIKQKKDKEGKVTNSLNVAEIKKGLGLLYAKELYFENLELNKLLGEIAKPVEQVKDEFKELWKNADSAGKYTLAVEVAISLFYRTRLLSGTPDIGGRKYGVREKTINTKNDADEDGILDIENIKDIYYTRTIKISEGFTLEITPTLPTEKDSTRSPEIELEAIIDVEQTHTKFKASTNGGFNFDQIVNINQNWAIWYSANLSNQDEQGYIKWELEDKSLLLKMNKETSLRLGLGYNATKYGVGVYGAYYDKSLDFVETIGNFERESSGYGVSAFWQIIPELKAEISYIVEPEGADEFSRTPQLLFEVTPQIIKVLRLDHIFPYEPFVNRPKE